MQRLFITIAMLFLNTPYLSGQWEIVNEGMMGWLSSIDFVDDNTGWIAGGVGLFIKTDDGGLTWYPLQISEERQIEKIDFINLSDGWAVGYASDIESNVILKTEDGGYNWSIVKQYTDEWYNDIQVMNNNIIFVSSNIKIIKTTSGGADWIDISPDNGIGNLNSIKFIDPEKGMAAGFTDDNGVIRGVIYRTLNGGSSWENNVLSDFDWVDNLQYTSNSVGYFISTNWESETPFFLCRTNDMGQSWEKIYSSKFGINSYFLSNNDLLYIAVYDSLNNINLLKSVDNGKNWQNIFSIKNWSISFLMFAENDIGLIVCSMGNANPVIMTNRIDKENWLTTKFSYPLNDVFFLNQNQGFSAGGYHIFHGPTGGDIFSTNDKGVTWSPHHSIPGWISSCEFVNDSIGYVMTRDWPWLISKTTDSGINWNIVYENNFDSTGYEFYGNDIFISTKDKLWAAGNYWEQEEGGAGIFNSMDGGISWNFLWKYPNNDVFWYNLKSICIINDIVWSVGENGLIARVVDSDSFQVINYLTDLPLNEVIFSDKKNGWIAGGYGYWEDFQPLLLKTSDGGKTWNKQENFPYMANELFFKDSLQGWAVGFDSNQEGIIVATNNGGESWYLQAGKLPGAINAIHFIGDYGWAVGELGQVLKTENGGASWIDNSNKNVSVSTFRLEQNYPNPFNPKTIINYELPITNDVEISIYNLLGQKVATLVSEKQPAGRHQVEWDASGFASGVYIYRLSAKGRLQRIVLTKKLVLLK